MTLLPHEYPDTSNMILEDDTPLDSFINEKQQRLLTTVFYSGAQIPINSPFILAANVGLFSYLDFMKKQVKNKVKLLYSNVFT
ncbi:MAG: hypothetical protein F6K22_03315 [Okeania sp. SIO2F4]|uniref:hypothetical protein n=1 Tax=Okeania sp. SIO2F4 TaxID=2607790 RepID=UPI00142BA746|nr:hypothetical protein [Okeania sp. SIO2F4]NES01943.1 hypothetical protein [Okeania sp. SIO2F4]